LINKIGSIAMRGRQYLIKLVNPDTIKANMAIDKYTDSKTGMRERRFLKCLIIHKFRQNDPIAIGK